MSLALDVLFFTTELFLSAAIKEWVALGKREVGRKRRRQSTCDEKAIGAPMDREMEKSCFLFFA